MSGLSSSSSSSIRSVPVFRHDDPIVDDTGVFPSEHLRWKRTRTSSHVEGIGARYVCIDPSRQYCAVYLSQAFIIELWDVSSLPCLMSRLTFPSNNTTLLADPPWDSTCHCKCMAWSDDGRFLCSVFCSRFSSACSLVMVWQVEDSGLLTIQQYVALNCRVSMSYFVLLTTPMVCSSSPSCHVCRPFDFTCFCCQTSGSNSLGSVPADVGNKGFPTSRHVRHDFG